jgi:hypothetical protein
VRVESGVHDDWLAELKAAGYEVQRFSDVHWRIGRVNFYPTKASIVVEGRKKEAEKGFIVLLKVLEREGVEPLSAVEAKPKPKPKKRSQELDFATLKIENPWPPECMNWLKMARVCVSSDKLSGPERAWVSKLLELKAKFELTSISFKEEKILIRLFRTSTRILKSDKIAQPRQKVESIEIESLFDNIPDPWK